MGNHISKVVADRLSAFCAEADELQNSFGIERWGQKVSSFLRTALSADEAEVFLSARHFDEWQQLAMRIGHLQGLMARAEAALPSPREPLLVTPAHQPAPYTGSRKIFVVHGRDNEAKEITARFLEKLKLEPIILHEQASSGRTLIEKFETYSGDIAFAVVLLTPDDVGGLKEASPVLLPRARQNVILELGYFMGRLGRGNVCALHKGGIELPSDYQGVAYIDMDTAGAWKAKVAQELIQAKLSIDLAGLVGG